GSLQSHKYIMSKSNKSQQKPKKPKKPQNPKSTRKPLTPLSQNFNFAKLNILKQMGSNYGLALDFR
ncbi:MAG: hypothetical protein J6Q83_04895, partial [Clostridia bacterium]|nr:hypothetical protein [Clostridia bacterium]